MIDEISNSFTPANWFWVVEGDKPRAWSSALGNYVDVSLVDWNRVARVQSEADLIAVLRRHNIPPYHRVAKSTILSRLGKVKSEQAFALASVDQQLRWNAPDKPMVNADDPETIAIISLIEEDPAIILAPEQSVCLALN